MKIKYHKLINRCFPLQNGRKKIELIQFDLMANNFDQTFHQNANEMKPNYCIANDLC